MFSTCNNCAGCLIISALHGKLLQKAQLMHCCIMLLLHYMQSRHTDKLSYLIPNVPGNNKPGPLCNLDTMTSCLISPHMSKSNAPLRRPDIHVMVDWALKINYLSNSIYLETISPLTSSTFQHSFDLNKHAAHYIC